MATEVVDGAVVCDDVGPLPATVVSLDGVVDDGLVDSVVAPVVDVGAAVVCDTVGPAAVGRRRVDDLIVVVVSGSGARVTKVRWANDVVVSSSKSASETIPLSASVLMPPRELHTCTAASPTRSARTIGAILFNRDSS